jgi:hypothetical protein
VVLSGIAFRIIFGLGHSRFKSAGSGALLPRQCQQRYACCMLAVGTGRRWLAGAT